MENQLVTVIKESHVEESTALTLQNSFMPFFNQANEWAEKVKSIIVTDASQAEEIKQAREGRLRLKEIRISADKKRKELKEDSLRYGKAVQGVYNVIEYMIAPLEKHLEEQEKFVETQREKIKTELRIKRESELAPYSEFIPSGLNLAEISEDDFLKIVAGSKIQLQMKIDAEKKAEEDRIAKEKIEHEEREKIRLENIKLKKEAEEREALAEIERKKLEKENLEREKKEKAEKEAREKALAAEREKAAKEKAEADKKLAEERAEKERIQNELKKKESEELRIKKEAEEKEKKSKLAPDKEKIVEFSKLIESLKLPDVSNAEAKKVILESKEMLNKISMYLLRQADSF